MHPNEIALVFTPRPGVTLPSREHRKLSAEAKLRGPAYVEAVQVQVWRQVDAVEQQAVAA